MSDFLTEMAETSGLRARAARESAVVSGLRARVASAPPPLPLQLAEAGFDVIAEPKVSSPSRGRLIELGNEAALVDLAVDFARSGAVAVSVLTEETHFAGSLGHLEAVSSAVDVPVMRKDFVVDPIQVVEARAAGASGVLLIARLLPEALLVEMTDQALELGLFVLLEVFDRADLDRAAPVFGREVLVGVNCRDLATLRVDLARFRSLAPHLPDLLPAVAESGIESEEDAMAVSELGYRLALIGSSLVTSDQPAGKLSGILSAGRSVLAGSR